MLFLHEMLLLKESSWAYKFLNLLSWTLSWNTWLDEMLEWPFEGLQYQLDDKFLCWCKVSKRCIYAVNKQPIHNSLLPKSGFLINQIAETTMALFAKVLSEWLVCSGGLDIFISKKRMPSKEDTTLILLNWKYVFSVTSCINKVLRYCLTWPSGGKLNH